MMELSGKSCLVTGGAGFIGSHLVDRLLAIGCRVHVLDDLSTGRMENLAPHAGNRNLSFSRGSVAGPRDAEAAVRGIGVVFHLACLGVRHSLHRPFENHRVNAEGALGMLEAARRAGVGRFIHCSSSEVYGTARSVPMPETHPARPCTVYGASKLAGESYALAYHTTYEMPTTVVRPFNTYGPRSHHEGDAGELIPKSIVRALAGGELLVFGDGSQTRDFTYVEDIARGLVEAARCDGAVGKVLNIGRNAEISVRDVAQKIIAMVGNAAAGIRHTPARPGDVLRLRADSSRFSLLTGWRAGIDFDEGLARTIDYFRTHPFGIERLRRDEVGRSWEGAVP